MSTIFEKASRKKLRIQTSKGKVSVEDLWTLTLPQLDKIAISLKKELQEVNEESFLETRNPSDTVTQLRFEVVLHVLTTKKTEAEQREVSAEKRAQKEMLLGILAEKQTEDLKGLSAAELEAKINAL